MQQEGKTAEERDTAKTTVPVPVVPSLPNPPPTIEDLVRAQCEALRSEYDLSEREVDVLALLARGYSSAAIQESLHIAAGTVNSHTRNIYQKLGVHSKSEIIALVGQQPPA